MVKESDIVINYLLKHRKIDFSGCSRSMIDRQLNQQLSKTDTGTIPEYYKYLQNHPEELDNLIDALTINVSEFFRDPLVFNYLSSKILPKLIFNKETSENQTLRIWSAGCAAGEEPYSIAMEINKLLNNVTTNLAINIFATDIDAGILDKACEAVYNKENLNNLRFEYLKHFTQKRGNYSLKRDIKQLVNFSRYDLLDKKSYSPPESLYGGFDLVLCRNVLIYYNTRYQNKIFTKLYRSLSENGYLVLGETESPTRRFQNHFRKVNDCCQIFIKNSDGPE